MPPFPYRFIGTSKCKLWFTGPGTTSVVTATVTTTMIAIRTMRVTRIFIRKLTYLVNANTPTRAHRSRAD